MNPGNRLSRGVPDVALTLLLAGGIVAFLLMAWSNWGVEWVGGMDAAAYAEVAHSLAEGRGFLNECLMYSYFPSQFAYPDVNHPEAHYPPLFPMLVAPWFQLLGKNAFAAKLLSMLIGSLFLPLVQYLLTRQLSKSRVVALVSAYTVMIFPMFVVRAQLVDEDLLYTLLVLLTCYLALKGGRQGGAYLLMGVTIGFAFLAKGTGILLLPAALIAVFARAGIAGMRKRRLWAGAVLSLLVISPWLVRNYRAFGDPFFSTQNYTAGHIAFESLEEGNYRLYEDGLIPTVWDKLRIAGFRKAATFSSQTMAAYLKWSYFDDIGVSWMDRESKSLYTAYTGIPALICAALLVLAFFRRPFRTGADRPDQDGIAMGDFIIPLVISIFPIIVLSILWGPFRRLSMPSTALGIAVGWSFIWMGVRRLVGVYSRNRMAAYLLLILLAIPPLFRAAGRITYIE